MIDHLKILIVIIIFANETFFLLTEEFVKPADAESPNESGISDGSLDAGITKLPNEVELNKTFVVGIAKSPNESGLN